MSTTEPRKGWPARNILIAAILLSALVGGVAGFSSAYLVRTAPTTQTREFYLFPFELEFDATTAQGLNSSYIFLPDRIVVNKGDTVIIHFYDTTDDDHTFTMTGTYSVDAVVHAFTPTSIENKNITIAANTAGIFQYHCRFHPPQMIGSLVVQG